MGVSMSSNRKRLLSNFISLSGVRIAGFIFPLITLPYLVRVLGPEKFGLIAFAQGLIQYFVIITDYGFNLSATREISINRNDIKKISEIFYSVILVKLVLTIISFVILSLIVFSWSKFRIDWQIYFLTFGVVVGQVIFPIWFFQGMEKMKYIAGLNILTKFVFTIAVFVFIHKESDYLWMPILYSFGFILSGVLGLWFALYSFKIIFVFPSYNEIVHQLKEGWHIFISTVAMSFYTTSNIVILGFFTNNTIVGYYSGGEKIVRAIQYGLLYPLSQTIYPHIGKLAHESKEAALVFVRKVIGLVGIPVLCVSVALLVFAPSISNIVLTRKFEESIPVMCILAPSIFVIFLNNLFGIQIMLNFGYQASFQKIVLIGGAINIVLVIILSIMFQHIGVAIAGLIMETYITCHELVFLYHKGIKFSFNFSKQSI
ncbi:MAG TPA: flippase [Phycisphaerales bacterium]|nr:flippase [Phycisphaerales bacterium]